MPELDFCPIELSYVVPCYFNQGNHQSLIDLLRVYQGYSSEVIDRIHFVLVDDCSPSKIVIPDDIDLHITLLRIDTDIEWNQGGARNLGIVYAKSDKLIATDFDHCFPQATLEYILKLPDLNKNIYKPARIGEDGIPLKPHPNTFIMSRARCLKFHGIDEEFSGAYGYEDGFFRRWQRYNGTRFKYLNKHHPIHVRAAEKENPYHSLARDLSHNRKIRERKNSEISTYGPNAGHSRTFLNFEWHVVEQRQRKNIQWRPAVNKYWRKLFWLRWLKCS